MTEIRRTDNATELAAGRATAERIDRALATYATAPGEKEADADAVQNLLDDSTRAFAAADTSSERVEVIRDLLAGWYAAWPSTAVTDPHEGIAWQLVSLVNAAEARASKPEPRPAAHPWQEYNAHGNTCHYPGCRMTRDEHEEAPNV